MDLTAYTLTSTSFLHRAATSFECLTTWTTQRKYEREQRDLTAYSNRKYSEPQSQDRKPTAYNARLLGVPELARGRTQRAYTGFEPAPLGALGLKPSWMKAPLC